MVAKNAVSFQKNLKSHLNKVSLKNKRILTCKVTHFKGTIPGTPKGNEGFLKSY